MLRRADSTTAGEPVSAFASASTPALAAMRRHVEQAVQIQTVRQVLARAALQAVYQPIVRLQTGVVMGHEALIRGPLESPLQRPDALFQAAREEGLTVELEQACLAQCLQAWAGHAADKRLFVNLSANALVLAEGIETAEELHIARDLGIEYGQGYFLGRPAAVPAAQVLAAAAQVIASSQVAILPEVTRAAGADFTIERLATAVPPLAPDVMVDDVARTFAADATLRALAVVEHGVPIGLLNRQTFVDRYAKPYFKELNGRKPCLQFANTTPLMLDKHTGLDALTAVLRYLTEGFIVTEGGCYRGLGTGEQLVGVVTEVRIEAARHANPLTFLPDNIPISEHIDRLLANDCSFVACDGDLNDFKPYNDHYGYWRGDEMIQLVARTLVAHCDPRRDFVGHVGGDDFVMLFQSEDWLARCARIVDCFNDKALSLFDESALQRGGIEAEDRHGVLRFFKFTTLSLGAVPVRAGVFGRAEQVASAAAVAKHKAKMSSLGLYVEPSWCAG